MVEDFRIGAQHLARPRIKRFAMPGQRHAPPIARQQRMAKPLLEPLDLHRHGRLRLVHPPRRFGKTAAIGDGAKALQLVEIEGSGHGDLHHSN